MTDDDSSPASSTIDLAVLPLVQPTARGERMAREAEMHRERHETIVGQACDLVELYRPRVGIESAWSIEVRVLCPGEMGEHEADIWWHAEVWYACLSLRCTLPYPLVEWCIVHELYELQDWRVSQCFLDVYARLLSGEDTDRLQKEWHTSRNQSIESRVGALLGKRRPFHITLEEEQKKKEEAV